MTYGGSAYGAFFYGGGQLRAVAERITSADRDELRRVAIEAAEIALERDQERALAFLAAWGVDPPPPSRGRVDDINAVMELLRNVVLVITVLLGGVTFTATQVQEYLERRSGQQLEQLPPAEDQQRQLESPPDQDRKDTSRGRIARHE